MALRFFASATNSSSSKANDPVPPVSASLIRPGARGLPSRSKVCASALARPALPVITVVSGRIMGTGRKVTSSRTSLGHKPARRNDDFPEPEAPSTTKSLSTPPSARPRMRSSARTIAASRPKKTAASSASRARKPRYGARLGSPGGGHGKLRGSSPARSKPRRRSSRPASRNARPPDLALAAAAGPSGAVRSHNCHSAAISTGTRSAGVASMRSPKIRLWSVFANRNSARHHLDASQAGEIRKSTASQRSAAALSASCQRSPTTRPRFGSTSRKTSL